MAVWRKKLTGTDCRRALEISQKMSQKLRESVAKFGEGDRHSLYLFDGTTLSEMELCFRQRSGSSFLREQKWRRFAEDRHLKAGDHIKMASIDIAQLPQNLAAELPEGSVVWRITARRDGRRLQGFKLGNSEENDDQSSDNELDEGA
ncbi:DNA-binding pseudobarrel domain containing protein [Trema orientale]|uniref:DNA-binding pseudobarrel domain containing protein n=1 Tax=Trema orientale TaxID=63057 RepID=A0A2P5FV40_TREOI|nr:DNA-binding pseudobarrel domain containing protein [Trema orientale]